MSHFFTGLLVIVLATGDALSPEESIDAMEVAPGVRVELVAAEPDVIDPVALAFDEAGRLYVVENSGYPEDDSRRGRVALLTAGEGGIYTRRSTFCDGLAFPNGVMPWKGGIWVTDAPQLLYFKDTDGDGRADVREVVLDGFSLGGSTQLRVSHPTLGLDNWLHLANGLSGGNVRVHVAPEGTAVEMGQLDLRFDPIRNRIERAGGRAQFGLSFDEFGHKFICSNRNHIQHVVFSPTDVARNSYLAGVSTFGDIADHGAAARVYPLSSARTTAYAHAGTFTAACGLVVYSGTALPPEFHGNAFVCEPTGNLVHRDVLERDGATFVAKRARDNSEFLRSSDEWFRPVFLANGPDGALYLCDMYRATIEHPTYLPPGIAEVTDFDAGKDRGRIYRLVGAEGGADTPESTDILAEPLRALRSRNLWTRMTAHRLLIERQDTAIANELKSIAFDDDVPQTRVHAISLLAGLRVLDEDTILAALNDRDPRVREFALGLARGVPSQSDPLRARILALGSDASPNVRYAAALALGDWNDEPGARALASVASAAPLDEWSRSIILSGIAGQLDAFAADYLNQSSAVDAELMRSLGRMIASALAQTDTVRIVEEVLTYGQSSDVWKREFLLGVLGTGAFDARPTPPLEALQTRVSKDAGGQINDVINAALREVRRSASSIELLGYGDFQRFAPELTNLLDARTSSTLQQEAVRALLRTDARRGAQRVLAKGTWSGLTAPVRETALTELLRRSEGAETLLTAVHRGDVPDWAVSDRFRQSLLHHRNPAVRERAQELFPKTRQDDRIAAYEALKPALQLVPNPVAGRSTFEERCAQCHTYGALGHEVGPDLTGIGSQPDESILLHVVAPNWLKLPGYEHYLVSTNDLLDYSGILISETDTTVTLRGPFGVESIIDREDIESIEMTGISLMPDNLEDGMSKQDVRDLIGFLKDGAPVSKADSN